jgi:hypothetical protein
MSTKNVLSRARAADLSDRLDIPHTATLDRRPLIHNPARRRTSHSPGRPFTLDTASLHQVRGHRHVEAGDGGLSWSQPKRASEAEVIIELGKPMRRCDSLKNRSLRSRYLLLLQRRQLHYRALTAPSSESALLHRVRRDPPSPRCYPHPSRSTFMRPQLLPNTHHIHYLPSAIRSHPDTNYCAHYSR